MEDILPSLFLSLSLNIFSFPLYLSPLLFLGFVCLPASSPGASCLLSGLYGTTEQKVSPGITYKVT